jgi:hypothetical protein
MTDSDQPQTTAEPDTAGPGPAGMAAADDARAAVGIRRSRGWGGLAGFGSTAIGAHIHGELLSATLERALIGGIAGYMVVWLAAVTAWRWIIRAELHRRLELLHGARTSGPQGEPR